MRKLFISTLVAAVLFSVAGNAQGKITVQVSNLKNNSGLVRLCLFDNAAAFSGKGAPVQCLAATVHNKIAVAVFENLPAGSYAISVFHDINKNNKLDLNFMGIPKEGYGASQNKLPFAAAPTFGDNLFTLRNGSHLQLPIRLRHL